MPGANPIITNHPLPPTLYPLSSLPHQPTPSYLKTPTIVSTSYPSTIYGPFHAASLFSWGWVGVGENNQIYKGNLIQLSLPSLTELNGHHCSA